MKTLLWKDFRQSRTTLVVGAGLLLVPYLIAVIGGLLDIVPAGGVPELLWITNFQHACLWSLTLAAVMCAFIGGNALSGERVDRSAEFAAYVPISRGACVTSKATIAVGLGTLLCMANGIVYYVTTRQLPYTMQPSRWDLVAVLAVTALLVLGIAWLFSSLIRSPSIAASAGMAGAFLVFFTANLAEEFFNTTRDDFFWIYLSLSSIIGLGAFACGVVVTLRRVEP